MSHIAYTENGAAAFASSGSAISDLFFKLIRDMGRESATSYFYNSWMEDPIATLKILLHCRDCRDGKGERLIVLYCLSWLRQYKPKTYVKNLRAFIGVGYYQDLLNLAIDAEKTNQTRLGTKDLIELEVFAEQLLLDDANLNTDNPVSLAAKWAPTEGHSHDRTYEFSRRIAKLVFPGQKLSHSMKCYRKLLTKLRNHLKVVERKMASNEWSDIVYSHVPAKAHKRYTEAFKVHDQERYQEYLANLKSNKTTIKSTGLQPHELVKPFMSYDSVVENEDTLQAQWNDMVTKQRNNLKGSFDILPLCDVSGSMEGQPMEVCIALGLMVSELATGPFKNKVLTFEANPKLMNIEGISLKDRVKYLKKAPWGGNTNLMAAFEQILNYAVTMNCTQEQLPKILVIFSDMQFDRACPTKDTVYELAKQKFEAEGYKLPSVVFWNLRDTKDSFPVSINDHGVALMSGFSSQLLKLFMNDPDNISPLNMIKVVLDKYSGVVVDESEIGGIEDAVVIEITYNHPLRKKRKKSKLCPERRRKRAMTSGNIEDDVSESSSSSDVSAF